ncbi:MAG: hypothetical protein AB7D51_00205 [Desulfovibrionaceae bacterium]
MRTHSLRGTPRTPTQSALFRAVFALFLLGLLALPSPPRPALAQQPAPVGEGLPLFAEFAYGQTPEELAAAEGAYDCTEAIGRQALCIDGREHLGQAWDAVLEFRSGRLVLVTLFTPFGSDIYQKTFHDLAKAYRLVAMQSQEPTLDMVALEAAQGPSSAYSGTVVDYESRGMENRSLAYVLLERAALPAKPAKDAVELRARALPSVLEAGVVLTTDDQGRDWLALSYSRPRLAAMLPDGE